MTKYDRIYVPCDENDSALYASWREEATDYVGAIQEKENVIVMTRGELSELCNHMVKEWVEAVEGGFTIEEEVSEDLDKYLESKGIQL